MKIIKSLQNDQIKNFAKLKEKKYRDETGLFIVEGDHLVRMAYEAKCLITLLVAEEDLEHYLDIIDEDNTIIVTESIINKLSFTKTPQNVIGIAKQNTADKKDASKVLVLDTLQDPGNVGTLIRSALAFDYDKVYVSESTVDVYNEKVVRASQGAIFKINIVKKELNQIYRMLKIDEFQIIVTSLTNNSVFLKDLKRKSKFAIVLGNEGNGVSEVSLNNATDVVKINMSDKIDSLNVAVAGSIVMYNLGKGN
jgi:TrmH family RNA methyltransferase